MINLEDLTGGSSFDINELVSTELPTDKPILNKNTANNLAAHTALLASPDTALDAYQTISQELAGNMPSPTMDSILGEANQRERDLTKSQMVEVLGDDTIPVEDKLGFVDSWNVENLQEKEMTPEELLQINQLEKDSLVENNEEVDETRFSIIPTLKQVNEYNDEVQRMINVTQIENSPGALEASVDFLEIVVPFLEGGAVAEVRKSLADYKNTGATGGIIQSLGLLGESKEAIRKFVSSVPVEKRLDLAKAVHAMVVESEGSLIQGKNSMVIMDGLRNYLVEGHYTTGERVLDDVTSMLDVIGVGALARSALKGTSSAAKAAKFMGRTPKSVAGTLADTNAKSYNEVLKMAADDTTGEVSKVVSGASREDFIVQSVGPEIGLPDGAVRMKPLVDDVEFNPDMAVVDAIAGGKGFIHLTDAEKASQVSRVREIIEKPDVVGLTAHKEMTTITGVDEGVNVRTVFGPADGGFASPAAAIDMVKRATRKLGVTDDEITLLQRAPDGTYKPVKAEDVISKTPPVKPGHTRYYYGSGVKGHDVKTQDDLWVTPDPVYARDYRKGAEDNTLWYVDIPNDQKEALGVRDAINNYDIIGKLPKEWAQKVERLQDKEVKGNFVVGINHTSRYDPADTVAWSVTDANAKWFGIPLNLFDRMPAYLRGKAGSITQHLLPPSSYIDPMLTRAASVATDQSARGVDLLSSIANDYASKYKSLDKVQKARIDEYIVRANHDSLKFNPVQLKADGFSDEVIETLRDWKRTNDTLYVLENVDLVRQSKRKGYELFLSKNGDDKFLVKPIGAPQAGSVSKAYDPELGLIRALTKKEKQELYKNGGTIATARTPIKVGDQSIPHVIVKNNEGSYTRALRDNDKLLNYRDGHFTIFYRDPIFITERVKNADGTEYTRAIATAGSTADAQKYIERATSANPNRVLDYRPDVKGEEFDDMMWDTRVSSGRTAQRTRGETLRDATDRPDDPDFRHIMSPEESITRSIQSISSRINMKEFIDTSKARFMNQYKQYLPRNPITKAYMWPDDVTQLARPTGKEANVTDFADAVSTYRYIDQMENGFVNLLDDTSKNLFKFMAETSGSKGWSWVEKGANAASEVNPTAWVRKKAFRLFLAANPLRQIPVQASQALPVILATNPTFMAKLPFQGIFLRYLDMGGDAGSFMKTLGSKLTGMTPDEAIALEKAYKESGLQSAVSAHSLIRDDLKQLVARGPIDKARAIAAKPIDVMQKYGFEMGENILMKSIWLSEYDNLRKAGTKIDAAALSKLSARVRDLSLNMNRAGELAYNENAFSAIMQFLQAPHKAFAQIVIGHRGLSRADRLKLGTSYILTYGTGYGIAYDQVTKLIPTEDKELQEVVSGGLFNLALNKTLGTIYGEPIDVDFSSSMRLIEAPNLFTLWSSLSTMNMEEVLKGSPGMGLLYGDNGKLGNLIRSIGRVFTVPEDDGNFKDVGVNFLNLFSGASNFMKARYIMQKGYATSTRGEVVDSDVNEIEAMMRIAGFATVDEMMSYAVNEKSYLGSKKMKDDIKLVLDETTRRLAREGIDELETEYVIRMMQEANRVWGDNPIIMAQVQNEISRRAKSGDHIIFERLLDMAGYTSEEDMREALIRSNLPEDQRKVILDYIERFKED